MIHLKSKSVRLSWLNLLCVLFIAAALSSGCGGLRKEKEPNYKQAKSSNPLEIPPDLTAIPSNPSTSIPTASGEPINDTQTTEQKFKKWKDFEEFEKWKRESGDEQAEFEAYQKFKKQGSGGASGLSDLSEISSGYASIETGDNGAPRLRINDSKENAWPKIEQSIEQSGAHIQNKNRRKGRFTVIPHKYWVNSGAGQKIASIFKKPKNRVEISVTESGDNLFIKIIPIANTDKNDVIDLIRRMHKALNTAGNNTTS